MRNKFRITRIKKAESTTEVEAENISDALRLLVQKDNWLRWSNGDWKEIIQIDEVKDDDNIS